MTPSESRSDLSHHKAHKSSNNFHFLCKLNHSFSSLFLQIFLVSGVLIAVFIDSTVAARNGASIALPERARMGEDVTLYCKYDIKSGSRLHKVRWLLNGLEFYRFERVGRPQNFYTPLPGANVNVNLLASDGEKVVLKNVSVQSAGLYSCEVTTEDSYDPLIGQGVMTVVTGYDSSAGNSRTLRSTTAGTVLSFRFLEKFITISSFLYYVWSIVSLLHMN